MGRGKSRRAGLIAALLLAIVIGHDLSVANHRGFAARAAIFAIDEYRAHVSPHLRGRVFCRFKPSCSAYGRESIRKHGFAKGGAKTAWRIARCGPWTKQGTIDPP
ncbi:MAG TPA: membrane protein insertion efficiency factor YidD [Thermoanaerobaculia bacterium]|nr:membrane protein insertion efficiency factor YidD [Thermoanaerobaculia bacterium]